MEDEANMERYIMMLDDLANQFPQVKDMADSLSEELTNIEGGGEDELGLEEPMLPTQDESALPELDLGGY